MRFAIEGRIDSVGAADIFLFLSQTQRTSVVAFERPDQETRVFFVEGQPVWCLSSKPQLQIDGRLAVRGGLKLRDIETALFKQKAGSNRIPQALIAQGMATEASMAEDVRALATDALRDLAAWTQGTFTVYDGVTPPPWAHTGVIDFTSLLVEALRGQCDKEVLQKEFVSRRCVLRPRTMTRSTSGLNDGEKGVFVLVNGERTVEEIIQRSGMGEFEALAALHVLCALHLIDLLSPERSGNAAAGGAPPADGEGPGTVPRGGSTNEFVGKASQPKRTTAPQPAVAAKSPASAGSASESTAKLPVLSEGPARKLTHSLKLLSEDGEDIPLTGATFTMGRHPRNDLVLKDPRVSSFHCRIELEGDRYFIVDLKSRNGTLLKANRIDRVALQDKDVIQLGSTKISYSAT